MKKIFGLVYLLCAGCASVGVPQAPQAAVEKARLSVSEEMSFAPVDPVSPEAAAKIASEYFHAFFGDCGGIGAAQERGDHWAFATAIGYAGTKGRDILVAKSGTCVFVREGAIVFWIDGSWRYDRTKYRGFFDSNFSSASKKEANQ